MTKSQFTLLKCPKCDYSWTTASQMKFVTCPNCLTKMEKEFNNLNKGMEKLK